MTPCVYKCICICVCTGVCVCGRKNSDRWSATHGASTEYRVPSTSMRRPVLVIESVVYDVCINVHFNVVLVIKDVLFHRNYPNQKCLIQEALWSSWNCWRLRRLVQIPTNVIDHQQLSIEDRAPAPVSHQQNPSDFNFFTIDHFFHTLHHFANQSSIGWGHT